MVSFGLTTRGTPLTTVTDVLSESIQPLTASVTTTVNEYVPTPQVAKSNSCDCADVEGGVTQPGKTIQLYVDPGEAPRMETVSFMEGLAVQSMPALTEIVGAGYTLTVSVTTESQPAASFTS